MQAKYSSTAVPPKKPRTNNQRQRCGRNSTRKIAQAPATTTTPTQKRTSATCGPGMPRETSRASMAMMANKVADTSKLAEARRAELGWAAGGRSVVSSGNKRLFREKKQPTRRLRPSPEDRHTTVLCGSDRRVTMRAGG